MNFPLKPPPIDCVAFMQFETRHRWRESAAWYPPGYRGTVRPADRWSETGYDLRGGPVLHFEAPEGMVTVNRDGFSDYEVRERDAADELEAAFRSAAAEARSAFGDDRLFVERKLPSGRHIEVQIAADR